MSVPHTFSQAKQNDDAEYVRLSERVQILENFVEKLFLFRKIYHTEKISDLTGDELESRLTSFLKMDAVDNLFKEGDGTQVQDELSQLSKLKSDKDSTTSSPSKEWRKSDTISKSKKMAIIKETTVTELSQEIARKPKTKIITLTLDSVIIIAPNATLRGKDSIPLSKLKVTEDNILQMSFTNGKKSYKFLFPSNEEFNDWSKLLQPYREGAVDQVSHSTSSSTISEMLKSETDSNTSEEVNMEDIPKSKRMSVFKWLPSRKGTKTEVSQPPKIEAPQQNYEVKDVVVEKHSTKRKTSTTDELLPTDLAVVGNLRLRFMAINELIQTERTYNKDLKFTVDNIISALRTQKCRDTSFLQLMVNLDWIIKYSDELVEQFDKLVEEFRDEGKHPILSRIFTEPWQTSMEHTLTSYCTSYPKTIATLDKIVKESAILVDYFEKLRWELLNGLDYHDFLIKPAQRICKYPLLLKEVLKYIPDEDPERQDLEKVCNNIQNIVAALNEDKRKTENIQKLIEVQDQFDVDISSPGREYIKSGVLGMGYSYNDLTEGKKLKNIKLFLFSDIIIVANPKMFGVSVMHTFKLQQTILGRLPHVKDRTAIANVFELFIIGESKKYYFFTRDQEEKNVWCQEIENLTTNIKKEAPKEVASPTPMSPPPAEENNLTTSRRNTIRPSKSLPPPPPKSLPSSPTSSAVALNTDSKLVLNPSGKPPPPPPPPKPLSFKEL